MEPNDFFPPCYRQRPLPKKCASIFSHSSSPPRTGQQKRPKQLVSTQSGIIQFFSSLPSSSAERDGREHAGWAFIGKDADANADLPTSTLFDAIAEEFAILQNGTKKPQEHPAVFSCSAAFSINSPARPRRTPFFRNACWNVAPAIQARTAPIPPDPCKIPEQSA